MRLDAGRAVSLFERLHLSYSALVMVEPADGAIQTDPQPLSAPRESTLARALLDTVCDAVIVVDEQMRVTYWGRGAESMYGLSAQAALGRRLETLHRWEWLQPEDEAAAYGALESVGSWRGENVHVLGSGERRHVESTVLRLQGPTGAPEGMLALIRDVTERVQGREALRASEERFRSVVDNSPDIIARFDRQMRHLFVSAEVERATGVRVADVLGKSNAELGMPAELVALWESQIQGVFDTGRPTQVQFPFRHGHATEHWEGRLLPEFGPGGEVASVLTLTRRVTAEIELIESLRKSEERANFAAAELRAVVDAVPVAVFIARDRESTRIDANRFGLELLRQAPGNNVSLTAPADERPVGFRCFQDGVELHASDLPVQRAAKSGSAVRDCEWDIVFDDGTVRNVLGNVEPLFDSNGEPRGAVSAVVDMTDRKGAERAVEETRKRLLGMISHELRNPLNAVSMAVAALKVKITAPEEQRLLEIVGRNIRIQSRLIDDLLDMSRASRGKLVSQRVPVLLDDVVTTVLDMLGPEAAARDLHVTRGLEGPDYVLGDRARLEQVVTNLVSNAIKFTPVGGRLGIETFQDGPSAHLVVSDTGIGLSHEQMQHAFEQFHQGEVATSSKRGLGLGLAIAKAIVEEHQGNIWVESAGVGKGARFCVELPSVKYESSRPTPLSAQARTGVVRVLIVEDNDDTRNLLTASLGGKGYEVASAASVDDAWALLEHVSPDLLLVDINLVGSSGLELQRRLQMNPRKRHVPAFAVTAQDSRDDIRKILDAGFSGHFVKPVDVNALDVAIREFLGSSM